MADFVFGLHLKTCSWLLLFWDNASDHSSLDMFFGAGILFYFGRAFPVSGRKLHLSAACCCCDSCGLFFFHLLSVFLMIPFCDHCFAPGLLVDSLFWLGWARSAVLLVIILLS
ncbi:uncharacterized protein BO97DRAFT_273854 [Aspergillus homomorphus CBS 101889]|uniref:Uncharacterized protein n=1 Tax=Aspergillus homomorphus (strain CBS 101889) TaxID=1450537 RepID=A0A395I4D7_ASPHC|nr:hypothetical protein BO97DRAFT_273854 [Aspergillus homomorphus CBS 101889]RAL14606.1 hypothetical protein BO97DRAFT_273854 [Aspergillus homomorphus CBS 101889]